MFIKSIRLHEELFLLAQSPPPLAPPLSDRTHTGYSCQAAVAAVSVHEHVRSHSKNLTLVALRKSEGTPFNSVLIQSFHIRIAPHTQTVFLNSCQLSGRSTAFQYSVLPSGLLCPHALSKCINAALPPQIERKAHPQLSGRLADFSSVPGYTYQPHSLAVYSLGVPTAMRAHRS